jgi:hypothetical protein
MLTAVDADTAVVVMVKVAVVAPAATVRVAGTVAAGLLLDKVTTVPPVGAWPESVTVPCELLPPSTEAGLRLTEESEGGVSSSAAVTLALL